MFFVNLFVLLLLEFTNIISLLNEKSTIYTYTDENSFRVPGASELRFFVVF